MMEFFFSTNPDQFLFIPTVGIQIYPDCRVFAITFACWSVGIAIWSQ